jgi:UDP-glucose 4-epimerase
LSDLRVVVTGGNGFLGRVLCKELLDNCELAILDKVLSQDQLPGVHQVSCDIADISDTSASDFILGYRPDAIVHLAAVTGIKKCEEDPRKAILVNVGGTVNIAALASRVGSLLIFASSREVYGETMGEATQESDPLNPNNLYGLTKLMGEQILYWFNRLRRLRSTILRFTNLYGPGGDQYVTSVIMKRALSNQDITIYSGTQMLNLVHVQDVARAVALALNGNVVGKTFNIGSKDTLTIEELVRKIYIITNSHSRIVHAEMRTNDTRKFIPNLTNASTVLSFSAKIHLEEGLSGLMKYHEPHANTT